MMSKQYFNEQYYTGSPVSFLRQFAPYFKNCRYVIDIGCGKGDFLLLLKEEGIDCIGYDVLEESRKYVEGKGMKFTNTLPDDFSKYDGIFMSAIIEHLTIEQRDIIFDRIDKTFHGRIVLWTADPREYRFSFRRSFWNNFEHVKPYTPRALAQFLNYHGFTIKKVFRTRYEYKFYNVRMLWQDIFRYFLEKLFGIMQPYCIVADKESDKND